jgi:hypothetical protein
MGQCCGLSVPYCGQQGCSPWSTVSDRCCPCWACMSSRLVGAYKHCGTVEIPPCTMPAVTPGWRQPLAVFDLETGTRLGSRLARLMPCATPRMCTRWPERTSPLPTEAKSSWPEPILITPGQTSVGSEEPENGSRGLQERYTGNVERVQNQMRNEAKKKRKHARVRPCIGVLGRMITVQSAAYLTLQTQCEILYLQSMI